MTANPYHRKLARVLDRMGGVYSVQDILSGIAENKMQGFVEGDSWAITKIAEYPRARVLEIIAVIGDLPDCRILHDRVLQYAVLNDIGLVQAFGRRGWIRDAQGRGWKIKTTSYLYQKEL